MTSSGATRTDPDGADPTGGLFAVGGEVGADLAAIDWASHPLGPPAGWPAGLRTALRTVLGSRFSMWMGWGPDLVFFCNEAYRRDTLGAKYPWALGRPASEVWAEIWADVSPRVETVFGTGQATWDEALMLFLERSGFAEETYHTFSYSPLADDEGRIAGMLCVVSEETDRVIGERRMETLRDLSAELPAALTEDALIDLARDRLEGNLADLPFSLLYLADDAGTARLVAASGTTAPTWDPDARGGAADDPDGRALAAWLRRAAATGVALAIEALPLRFATPPGGVWPEPVQEALVVALAQPGQVEAAGYLVAGLNRYRPLDAAYRGFVRLVAGQLSSQISTVRAYQQERDRAEQLAELDRAKTAFFTNVSHEFRTPLTLLLGPTEDALADTTQPLGDEQRRRMEIVDRNGRRLLRLVNTLLDFSRINAGTASPSFEPVDLALLTRDLADTFAVAVERAGLRLSVDCPHLSVPVAVDQEMWANIVLNLLSNALKFTFEGGITVRLAEVGGEVELSVSDTGIGIPAAEQERLFERFHRVVGARSRTHEGSGIGLALIAELAAVHGGVVTVESELGSGSTFRVRLPLRGRGPAAPPAMAPGGPATPAPPAPTGPDPAELRAVAERQADGYVAEAMRWLSSDHDGGHRGEGRDLSSDRARILVVDDSADMRDHIVSILGDAYAIETAPDGRAALERALADPPDLVLTDVMMPELDGFGLLAALRAEAVTVQVPVVMISARAGEEGLVEGLEAGADDYVVKPFTARELRARVRTNLELDRSRRVRAELERRQRLLDEAEHLAHVGSWELDAATGRVSASDELLRLFGVAGGAARGAAAGDALDVFLSVLSPEDRPALEEAIAASLADGRPLRLEYSIVRPGGEVALVRASGVTERSEDGTVVALRGFVQDITEQRRAEQAEHLASLNREAAAREHQMAEQLQASLLPPPDFTPDHLAVATFYRAGAAGTRVGGDWYDVIELGVGRTALVVGDVMGQGVQAAAVMGQLRSAVRAYARLDLAPADVLGLLDETVREVGEDQIVTCVYAVYDPFDSTLTYANAGHVPPLVHEPGRSSRRLSEVGAPLGAVSSPLTEAHLDLPAGTVVALYTDGLVERRTADLDEGIDALAGAIDAAQAADPGHVEDLAAGLADRLLPDGPSDDVAILVAQTPPASGGPTAARFHLAGSGPAVREGRRFVDATLREWGIPAPLVDDAVLAVDEMATNAVLHGRAPIELRLRRTRTQLYVEVLDGAAVLPHAMTPGPDDEHGRGLQMVALLARRWGARPTRFGKSVWCTFALPAP